LGLAGLVPAFFIAQNIFKKSRKQPDGSEYAPSINVKVIMKKDKHTSLLVFVQWGK
jgi:hypothetical protein